MVSLGVCATGCLTPPTSTTMWDTCIHVDTSPVPRRRQNSPNLEGKGYLLLTVLTPGGSVQWGRRPALTFVWVGEGEGGMFALTRIHAGLGRAL